MAFWKLDRANRIASQCIEWIGRCREAGVYLVPHQDSDQEPNTATAGAKLITGIKALLAEVETDSMSERQLAAKRHLAQCCTLLRQPGVAHRRVEHEGVAVMFGDLVQPARRELVVHIPVHNEEIGRASCRERV